MSNGNGTSVVSNYLFKFIIGVHFLAFDDEQKE